jgi:hypothetical protein
MWKVHNRPLIKQSCMLLAQKGPTSINRDRQQVMWKEHKLPPIKQSYKERCMASMPYWQSNKTLVKIQ